MITVRFRTIIIPRGDTGFLKFPNIKKGDIAIFSLLDKQTNKTVLEKITDASDRELLFHFDYTDTQNLEVKTYYWDIKIYKGLHYDSNGNLINADEIDSYYSAYKLPECIIREVI